MKELFIFLSFNIVILLAKEGCGRVVIRKTKEARRKCT